MAENLARNVDNEADTVLVVGIVLLSVKVAQTVKIANSSTIPPYPTGTAEQFLD